MFDITNIPSICSTRLRSDVSGYETDTAIINVEYNTRYELCSCFMRIQEFYESDIPVIRGNYFTLDQYMDEYAKRMADSHIRWIGLDSTFRVVHIVDSLQCFLNTICSRKSVP